MIFKEISVSWAVLIIFSSVLSLYVSAYAYHRKQVQGAKALSFFMLSVALYSLGYALEINSESLVKILDSLKFEVFWATFTAPAFFLFVVEFLNRKTLPNSLYIVLFVIPVGIGLLALTNDQHAFLYSRYWIEKGSYFPVIRYEPGMGYIIQLAYLILVSLCAEILLLIHLFRGSETTKKRTVLVLIAGILPTLSAILNPDRETFSGLDIQPFVFSITGVLLAVALFHFRMLDLRKIAREYAVDVIHDYLLIIDTKMVVIDINDAGKNSSLLDFCEIDRPLTTDNVFVSSLIDNIAMSGKNDPNKKYSIQVKNKHYQYSLAPIHDTFHHIQGYVLLVNDYTKMANLLAEMEEMAIKDGLTNIFNRRHLFHLAKREIKIAARNGSSLSVILFDLDNFKSVNDTFGHLAGDAVLKKITEVVQSQLRITEIFGRYGGEEFCVICPNTEKEEAQLIAERLREHIEKIDWTEYGIYTQTASFGVCTGSRLADYTIEELLSRADAALYQAKSDGKNRISVYEQTDHLNDLSVHTCKHSPE
ncbi:histidine kinase N-terminal 7TM domain-containing diguanylate cyclase [Vibrio sp. HA2012]|uniref:histidine kinase N-terminal 7TM domain-containing diguanylate cyclase n=1 Tax=Vibrio sp. HA2012 TaxID=1971595 RepID=UPI0018E25AE6|nr:diguanylate cyclase [Vibrio sp. HA2012]